MNQTTTAAPTDSKTQAAADLLAVGVAPRAAGLDDRDLAAWTATARAVLNLHEAIARY